VRNFAGATILGSGKTSTDLECERFVQHQQHFQDRRILQSSRPQVARKSVLIAEDSITSRALIKNIVESAGYDVKATVDGPRRLHRPENRAF